MNLWFVAALQVVIALGLLNVWLCRRSLSSPYRGGDAKTLRQEFAAYRLPAWFFWATGTLKIGVAIALLSGFWFPSVIFPAATVAGVLMLGAVVMHLRVADAPVKSMPAAIMLVMSAGLAMLSVA
ncbi:MAG: DoxX family protein [Planctomycetes bacterium]|nr:DoxX family protein [Planctomycetota bacterium]